MWLTGFGALLNEHHQIIHAAIEAGELHWAALLHQYSPVHVQQEPEGIRLRADVACKRLRALDQRRTIA